MARSPEQRGYLLGKANFDFSTVAIIGACSKVLNNSAKWSLDLGPVQGSKLFPGDKISAPVNRKGTEILVN